MSSSTAELWPTRKCETVGLNLCVCVMQINHEIPDWICCLSQQEIALNGCLTQPSAAGFAGGDHPLGKAVLKFWGMQSLEGGSWAGLHARERALGHCVEAKLGSRTATWEQTVCIQLKIGAAPLHGLRKKFCPPWSGELGARALLGRNERCPSSSADPGLALESWGLLLTVMKLKSAAHYKCRGLQPHGATPRGWKPCC